MKNKWLLILSVVVVFAFLALNVRGGSVATVNAAPRDGVYDISWYTIDGGGAQALTGGTYWLGGTTGQPDAGALSGGTYTLSGGFWNAAQALLNQYFYLPFISK